jgi:hypothetical protein
LDVEHPIAGDELRAIKRYMASRTDALPWLFISERGQPFTRQSVNYLIAEAAAHVGLPPTHPHMLRHSCGFSLANRGYDLRLIQDYLGHRKRRRLKANGDRPTSCPDSVPVPGNSSIRWNLLMVEYVRMVVSLIEGCAAPKEDATGPTTRSRATQESRRPLYL